MKKLLLLLALTVMSFGGDAQKQMQETVNKINAAIKKAKQTNDPKDQMEVSLYFSLLKMDEDAFKWVKMASDQGNRDAQYFTAIKYRVGAGVKQDIKKSIQLFEASANQGKPEAQNELAIAYRKGDGVEQDYIKAAELYTKASNQGYKEANLDLGLLYYAGNGVKQDKTKTYTLWLELAKQGNTQAQGNLDILCKESPWACK